MLVVLFNTVAGKLFPAKLRYASLLVVLVGILIPFRPIFGDGLVLLTLPDSWQSQGRIDNGVASVVPMVSEAQSAIETEITAAPLNMLFSPTLFFVLIWNVTAGAILVFHLSRYIRFRGMIRRWGKAEIDENSLSILRWEHAQAGLAGKTIALVRCDFISTSMLVGFWHPVILLPGRDFDDDELHMIFAHELAHCKRRDLLVKLFSIIAVSMYWFNPLVYWICSAIQAEGETCCDEAVLRGVSLDDRRFYGEVIIGMIARKPSPLTMFSTCFYTGKANIKRRLDFIMSTGQKKNKLAIATVALTCALTLSSSSVIALDESSEYRAVALPANSISAEAAMEIALAKVGGGTITEYGIRRDNEKTIYEIKIAQDEYRYRMNVDAIDGEITRYASETIRLAGRNRVPAISIESARAIALKHAGVAETEVTFVKSDLYDKNGVLRYDFNFKDSNYVYSCEVGANTGSVIAFYVKNISPQNLIGEAQAKKIAITKAGGGIVTQCKLDDDDGRIVYEIKIRNGKLKYEMCVDAFDGAITDFEMD
jgi:beta-lactamase regulating signal transducer with metallopeptidase domain